MGMIFVFLFTMFVLVFMSSLYGALVGWDGLGVSSFLLVIFYSNRKSLGSGFLTSMTNRLGDCFFLTCLGIVAVSAEKSHMFVMLLILTSMTKSAQLPFSAWLPAAMAAPTPVSALVHSSTLVTAGVYLLIRFNGVGTEALLLAGSMTLCLASLCACVECDLKKVVALSTLSQLGVMMVALALGRKELCFFHLMTHAMFKALIFLCVGTNIHSVYGTQDMRSYASMNTHTAASSLMLTTASLSLAGFPFMSGFYSKDAICEAFYSQDKSLFLLAVFLVGVGLTAVYSFKFMWITVYNSGGSTQSDLNGGGYNFAVKMPLFLLAVCSVASGALLVSGLSGGTTVVYLNDKIMPMSMVALGVAAGARASHLKYSPLAGVGLMAPLFQYSASSSVEMVGSTHIDTGVLSLTMGTGMSAYTTHMLSVMKWFTLVGMLSILWLVA